MQAWRWSARSAWLGSVRPDSEGTGRYSTGNCFCSLPSKILIPNDFRLQVWRERDGRNIEKQGLAAKIFRNKDLEQFAGSVVQNGLGDPSRIGLACAFTEFSSVKVVRHKNWNSFCGGLWKRGGGRDRVRMRKASSTSGTAPDQIGAGAHASKIAKHGQPKSWWCKGGPAAKNENSR